MNGRFVKTQLRITATLACIAVALYLIWGISYKFTPPNLYFWLLIAGILLIPSAVSFICTKFRAKKVLTAILHYTAMAVVTFGIIIFLVIETLICISMTQSYSEPVDCVIVLGARVNGTRPSVSLENRLEVAYDYLTQHPDADVILSGGQGDGEDITEARCMYEYLTSRGISADRIYLEERSTSTAENILFSKEIYNFDGKSVALVSSGFHLYRAKLLARSNDIEAYGIAAPSEVFITPHYMMREAVTTVVDILRSNVKLSRFFG